MASVPTQRTLKELRERGWAYQVLEKFQRFAGGGGFKKDCWGADIIALDGLPGSLLIQTTSDTNHAARRTKVLAIPEVKLWLDAGNRFHVWTWGKRVSAGRGSRKVWTLREEEITLEQLRAAS